MHSYNVSQGSRNYLKASYHPSVDDYMAYEAHTAEPLVQEPYRNIFENLFTYVFAVKYCISFRRNLS